MLSSLCLLLTPSSKLAVRRLMPRGVPSTRRRNVFAHQRRHSATIGSQRDVSSTTIHHRTFANMFAHQTMMPERDDIAMQHTRSIYCGRRVIETERSADRPNRGANAARSPRCRPCRAARRDAERRGAKRVERVEMATGAGATRVVLQRNAAADRGDLKSKFGGRPARVSRRRGGGG